MTFTREGKNNHFFYAGLAHIIGAFIVIVLTMIFNYLLANVDYYVGTIIVYVYGVGSVILVIKIVINVFLFLAFNNLDTKLNLKSTKETDIITKLILAQLILIVLILVTYGLSLIGTINRSIFYVVGVGYILSGLVGLFTYLYIYKLIRKQESDVMAKTISKVFLVYSITFFLNGTLYGISNFDISGLFDIIQPLVTTFNSLESLVSIIVAFIYIIFSVKFVNKTAGIIVPKQNPASGDKQKHCESCGKIIPHDTKFCVSCVTKIE